jgi:hypothetical protein
VSTTVKELEKGAGKALTGGGSLLPMADLIRMAHYGHHYLAIFDQGKAVGLYTPSDWPHRVSELSCTPGTVGAPARVAM